VAQHWRIGTVKPLSLLHMIDIVTIAISLSASVLGGGFGAKIVSAVLKENMRKTFLTQDAAKLTYLPREYAANKYMTKEAAEKEHKSLADRIDAQWESITEHVIAPLRTISEKLEAVMLSQARIEERHAKQNS
jgi:hypothetical protein